MSVSRPLPHDAARLHVSGEARYTDDIPAPPGTLHLAFGLSRVARGRIVALDLSEVRASPGVVAVVTAEDLPGPNDTSPSAHDEPLLANDRIHYAGQPLFIVAATSHRAARAAARRYRIEVQEEEPILTVEQALAARSYLEPPITWEKGDAVAAIAAAPRQLSGRITIGGQEHFYLEGQAALALPQEGGDMVVHASTQHPTEIQHKVAEALGVPFHAVRVETRRMGGGFGGKESQGNALACACAVVARLTGRPARMRYDRDDDFLITGKRHDFRIDYRVGFDDEGRILGVAFEHYVRCGWSQDLSLPVCDRAMLHADNAYHLPAARITSHRLRTNMQSATAFRGFGGPQGMLGIERVIDHVAHSLGRDPAEVRRANFYASQQEGGGQTTPYGMIVEDSVIREIVAELTESAEYARRREAVAEFNARGGDVRRGLALTPVKFGISFTLTHLNQAGALVHVYSDGSIHLNHGGTEMGQGLFTKVAQVAANAFGQPLEAVKITATDTGKVPNTSATAASSGSDLNGMATLAACEKIIARLRRLVAERWQVSPSEVRFEDGLVRAGSHEIPFREVVTLAYTNRVQLSATGFYATPKINWDRAAGRGRPFYYFAYGAAVSEVAVDTLTGEYRLLRTDILHDVGRSLNPAIDRGQIEGGFVQGTGWLTTEELVWDERGALRTHAPSTYKIPACADRPRIFNVAFFDNANREETIHRSKAVGEPPLMLGISAFLALSDAIASCGPNYPALDAPATPEQVLRAIHRARGEPWGGNA